MQFSEFIGEVQNQLELPSEAKAVRSTRAVVTTLSERLYPGEAEDLAGSLPMEIDHYAREPVSGQSFDRDEFIDRVSEIEEVDRSDAHYHIQVVLSLMAETVPAGEMRDIYQELPEEFDEFFEHVDLELE